MSCYIVVFEISNPSTTSKVEKVLKNYGFFCPITENSWAIVTDEKATDIRNKVGALIGANDRVFVVRSGTAAAWKNSYGSEHDEWLKKYL